ncbi:MAG: hypothetical protein ABIA74_04950 [bacterium]
MLKKYLLLVPFFLTFGLRSNEMEIPSKYLRTKNLKNVKLFHNGNDFIVEEESGKRVNVERAFVDKEVREISDLQLSYLLGINKRFVIDDKEYVLSVREISLEDLAEIKSAQNIPITKLGDLSKEEVAEIKVLFSPYSLLELSKTEQGEYIIHCKQLLNGGGAGGAAVGCWIGKLVVYGVGHGFIVVSSVAAGIATANPATTAAAFMQMEAALGAEIEAASQVGAMVGGILGGVATGPA